MNNKTFTLNFTATPEQIAQAAFGALLAQVDALYTMQMMFLTVMPKVATGAALAVSTGNVDKGVEVLETVKDEFPVDVRRERLAWAYDMVIRAIPVENPFRTQLEARRDQRIADMKE